MNFYLYIYILNSYISLKQLGILHNCSLPRHVWCRGREGGREGGRERGHNTTAYGGVTADADASELYTVNSMP